MIQNLCKRVLENGGAVVPLVIPADMSGGTGLMNPSIFILEDNIYVNIRHINYILYHSEAGQLFQNRYGPLAYLNPENDVRLATTNFLCELDKDLAITKVTKVDTSQHDVKPKWEFHGLEDARLAYWEHRVFLSGVRRDTTDNGQGRIELSRVKINATEVKEVQRTRIPSIDPDSYCEKNWMPIMDMPFHWVKWTNPTEVVRYIPETKVTIQVHLGKDVIHNVRDFRGSSQVIPWGKSFRLALVHEVDLFNNKLGQKDAKYYHRFIVWDLEWNIIKMSDEFSFMGGEIEFCAGAAWLGTDLIATFGFQDNGAYAVRIPERIIAELVGFVTTEGMFDWGMMSFSTAQHIASEVLQDRIYERIRKVKKGDVIVDIGANVGAFTYSILKQNPKMVYCIEPSTVLFPSLKRNVEQSNVTCINMGVSNLSGDVNVGSNIYCQKEGTVHMQSFKWLMENCKLDRVDFLKIDCEGGEYDIFIEENQYFLENSVSHIAAEFHVVNHVDDFIRFCTIFLKPDRCKVFTAFDRSIWEDVTEKCLMTPSAFTDAYVTAHGPNSQLMIYISND